MGHSAASFVLSPAGLVTAAGRRPLCDRLDRRAIRSEGN